MYLTLLHTEFQKQEYKSVYQGDCSCQNYTSFYVNLECITKSNTNVIPFTLFEIVISIKKKS